MRAGARSYVKDFKEIAGLQEGVEGREVAHCSSFGNDAVMPLFTRTLIQ